MCLIKTKVVLFPAELLLLLLVRAMCLIMMFQTHTSAILNNFSVFLTNVSAIRSLLMFFLLHLPSIKQRVGSAMPSFSRECPGIMFLFNNYEPHDLRSLPYRKQCAIYCMWQSREEACNTSDFQAEVLSLRPFTDLQLTLAFLSHAS